MNPDGHHQIYLKVLALEGEARRDRRYVQVGNGAIAVSSQRRLYDITCCQGWVTVHKNYCQNKIIYVVSSCRNIHDSIPVCLRGARKALLFLCHRRHILPGTFGVGTCSRNHRFRNVMLFLPCGMRDSAWAR